MSDVRRFAASVTRRLRRLAFPLLRRADTVGADERDAGLSLLYRFILGRPIDDEGRRHYLRLMAEEGLGLREVAAEIAASDELQRRLRETLGDRHAESAATPVATPVDIEQLKNSFTIDELAEAAEQYYATTVQSSDHYLAKPFDNAHEAPELLGSFAQLLGGLQLTPGLTVLDFGAGAGWTTRILAQLGCVVISLDVSKTALELGRRLFARLPPVGNVPEPTFLRFDGRHIDLPDDSVDRIVCFDAFHHVPNPSDVISELGRVLRRGGIAAFSEPGPSHSAAARSQYEMKNYTAFENDVVIDDVWKWAQGAGFSSLELAVFTTESHRVPVKEFNEFLEGGNAVQIYGKKVRSFLRGHQTFFLMKGGPRPRDSRDRSALKAEIAVHLERSQVRENEQVRGEALLQNVGTATWLPSDTPVGGVTLGVHLRLRDGQPIEVDFARIALPGSTKPGEQQKVQFAIGAPKRGDYIFEFDMVSEHVAWFEMNESATCAVRVEVV